MGKYNKDRSFTNYVHSQLAIPLIYSELDWKIKQIPKEELEYIDMHEGIDYVVTDKNNKTLYIQERFRDVYYKDFNDATLRYRRDYNKHKTRVKSEFYKIKADYLLYGITNGKKFLDKRHTLSNFIKWVVLDLDIIRKKFIKGELEVTNSSRIKCWIKDNKLVSPINYNDDTSSSFIPLDIKLIIKLWGSSPIIAQKGFV